MADIRYGHRLPTARSPAHMLDVHQRPRGVQRARHGVGSLGFVGTPPVLGVEESGAMAAVLQTKAEVLTRDEALRRAEALVPVLRERAPAAEAGATVPAETLFDLHRAGLFRILQPRRFGGSELDVGMLVDMCAILARGCPSTAWVWANYASHHWMLALWPDEAQRRIWDADPDALIASSFVFPAGRAKRVAGGYRVRGRWPFSSGVDPASWDMLAGVVEPDDGHGTEELRIFLLPRHDFRVIDNWQVMGLAATNSKDVEVDDIFVPAPMTLALDDTKGAGTFPGAAVNPGATYRVPVMAFFPYCLTGIPLGIAQAAYDDVVEATRRKAARYTGRGVADYATVQVRIAEAAAHIDAARLMMRANCADAQRLAEAGSMPDPLTKAKWRRDGAYTAQLCARAVDSLFTLCGGTGIYDANAAQRQFRDVHAAISHISMTWDVQATTFGRVALGLPADNATL